jgi:CheY-like chemotaxis protein
LVAALHKRNMHPPPCANALISKELSSMGVSRVHSADVLRVTPRSRFETARAHDPSVKSNEYQRVSRPARVAGMVLASQRSKPNQISIKVTAMTDKRRVLVVDDNEIVRLSYLRSLTAAQCNVETAWNGDEALRAMEEEPFDVVLLDLRMPGMSGMDVLKAIKEKWPDTEVVVITGYPSLETAKEAVQLGAHNYLAKPVGPVEVIKATSDAVTQKQWALHPLRMQCEGSADQDAAAQERPGAAH